MMERLRARASAMTLTERAAVFALTVGLLLLMAYALSPYKGTQLYLPVALIVVALVGFGLSQTRTSFPSEQMMIILVAATMGIGLTFPFFFLPLSSAWWIALVSVALLFTLLVSLHSTKQAIRLSGFFLGMTIIGALFGLSPFDAPLEFDTSLLGLGLLVVGQIVILVYVGQQQSSTTSPKTSPFNLDLNHMVMQLHVTADGLVRAVDAINHVGHLQHDGASEQADLIGRTNELLSDFLELSGGIREQARSITQMAQQAAELSQNGQATIQQAIQGMEEIRAQVSAIAGTILALAQFTQRIDEIITSVSEIATQSNLLALNASIEAARAGVHGRGFAVVADEVRSLSQQSTQAARQVRAILGEIQNAMKETIRATEVGLQGVDAGVAMTQQADTVMVQLAQNVTASHEAVRHIYEVILEQVNGLEEIAISVERIDRITQQNLTATSTVRTVSTELTRLAADLQATVGLTGAINQDAEEDSEQHAGETQRDPQENRAPQQAAP